MFNFLNSTVLIAAAAALIPLLIHLFSKRRVRTVEFSSLKHLKEMQKRQVRRLKIRQLLLLLLRMMIILAIVLAFARPTTEGGSIGSHASVSAVILFDNSASMNRQVRDGNLFDIARKRTEKLLDTFGESDEVRLVPLNQPPGEQEIDKFSSAAVATNRLESLGPGYGEADLRGALAEAHDLLSGASNLNKEIYIVSDRQRTTLPDSGLPPESEAMVYMVDLPLEETGNCGITKVDLGGQLLIPGQDFDIVATARNYGEEDRDDLIASLYLDGRRVAQTDVSVAAGSEEAVRFTQSVTYGGFHSGWVELSDDLFTGDNREYFAFRIPEQFNVLIISGEPSAQFISLALVPSATTSQYWSVKTAAPDELGSVNVDDYDVVVLAGAPTLPTVYVDRIKSSVRRGTSLLVTYGLDTDAGFFNDHWSDVTGVVIDDPARKDFTRAGYFTLEKVNIGHPIFTVFGFDKGKLPDLRFYTLPRVHTTGGATTLAEFSGDRPALIDSRFGSGRVVTFTGPISPAQSDITGHAFFVPFVSRIAEYLAADLSGYDLGIYSRDQVARSVSIEGSISGSLELVAPDSTRYYLAPEEDNGNIILRASPVNLPGIYSVKYLGREVDRFAVNLDPRECNLAMTDLDEFARAVGAPEYRELDNGTDLAGMIAEFRYGKELWQLFLWIAVVLLLFEMLLSRGAPAEE